MSINDEIRKAVSAYFSTLSAMDVEAWLALFEPDATGHDPGIPLLVGHDQLRKFFDGLLDHFAAFSVVPEEIFSCDSGAAARWRAQATTKAGHDVAFSGIETFEISAQGKIQSVRAYWDPSGLVAQLKS